MPDSADVRLSRAQLAAYREELAFLLGVRELFALPRSGLNLFFTGTIEADDYILHKLYYESLLGFYVSANLYVPKNPERFPLPRPAVICPHGHYDDCDGKCSRQVQVRAIGLVKLGYVVLTYDAVGSGERWNNVKEGHDWRSTASTFVGGPLSMGVQAYEVSRAIDLLETLPHLARTDTIAVTGASGGASQTIFAALFEPRIKVIVPVVNQATGVANDFGCGCGNIPYFDQCLSRSALFALVYPTKALYLNQFFDEEACLAKSTYVHFGQSESCRIEVVSGPHGYGAAYRQRAYAWLSRWVLGTEAGDTLPDPPGVSDTMRIRSEKELSVGLPIDGVSFLTISSRFRKHLPQTPLPETPKQWAKSRKTIRTGVANLMNLPPNTTFLKAESQGPERNPEAVTIVPEDLSLVLLKGAQSLHFDSRLQGALHKPDRPGPWPCVVLLNPGEHPASRFDHERTYRGIDPTAIRSALLKAGYAVLAISLRFSDDDTTKEDIDKYVKESAVAVVLNWRGVPLFGKRVQDARVAVSYLRTRVDILPEAVSVWGMGYAGPVAVTAGALDERICQVVADRSRLRFGATFDDRHAVWTYPPKILTQADVAHLASAIAPRRMIFSTPVDDARAPLLINKAWETLAWAQKGYAAADASGQLVVLTDTSITDQISALDPHCDGRVADDDDASGNVSLPDTVPPTPGSPNKP